MEQREKNRIDRAGKYAKKGQTRGADSAMDHYTESKVEARRPLIRVEIPIAELQFFLIMADESLIDSNGCRRNI